MICFSKVIAAETTATTIKKMSILGERCVFFVLVERGVCVVLRWRGVCVFFLGGVVVVCVLGGVLCVCSSSGAWFACWYLVCVECVCYSWKAWCGVSVDLGRRGVCFLFLGGVVCLSFLVSGVCVCVDVGGAWWCVCLGGRGVCSFLLEGDVGKTSKDMFDKSDGRCALKEHWAEICSAVRCTEGALGRDLLSGALHPLERVSHHLRHEIVDNLAPCMVRSSIIFGQSVVAFVHVESSIPPRPSSNISEAP